MGGGTTYGNANINICAWENVCPSRCKESDREGLTVGLKALNPESRVNTSAHVFYPTYVDH